MLFILLKLCEKELQQQESYGVYCTVRSIATFGKGVGGIKFKKKHEKITERALRLIQQLTSMFFSCSFKSIR